MTLEEKVEEALGQSAHAFDYFIRHGTYWVAKCGLERLAKWTSPKEFENLAPCSMCYPQDGLGAK